MATMSLQGAYDQTRRWIESNDPERAIGLAQHILNYYPNNLEAYRILGEAYLASRQLDKAQEAFDRVLRSDPENIPAHVGLGISYERQGKLDRAVLEFEQAWEIRQDMTELRTQLQRLYTEAWGKEHAQVGISKAGLARLYAKGHMLPQAINEFRQVITEQPARQDAKVALAEALWRDGQENEAIAQSKDILAQRPESLKANLLLGYIYLAQGKPDGQRYWDTALQIDPYLTVGKVLFDTLPAGSEQNPELPEWDADEWLRQRELEKQPVPAATRPIPIAELETPVAAPQRTPQPAAVSAGNNDDFLAVLLAGTGATTAAAAAAAAAAAPKAAPSAPIDEITEPINANPFSLDDLDFGAGGAKEDDAPPLTPFSLSDLGLSDDEIEGITSSPSASEITQPGEFVADEPETAPFSLADLGLSDDEIASISDASVTESPAPSADEPEMAPFSLADLGLSDDEIASIDSASTTAPSADEPEMAPFSLADLGLSDDEIASISDASVTESPAPAADEPEMTPFSLADLGLSDDEIASIDSASTAAPSADEPEMAPFSLADLGLSDDEIASISDASVTESPAPAADEPEMTPFSLADLGLSDDEIASIDSASTAAPSADEPEMTPFSLADLGLSDDEIASIDSASTAAPAADEPEMTPFSLADLGLSDDEIASINAGQIGSATPDMPFGIPGQNPSSQQDDLPDDLLPFSFDELDLDNGGGGLPPSLQPFSLDDAPMGQPRSSSFIPPEPKFNRDEPSSEDDEDTIAQSGGYSWQQPTQRPRPAYVDPVTGERDPLMPDGESIFSKLKTRKEQEIDSFQPIEPPLSENFEETPNDRMIFSMDDISLRDDTAEGAAHEQLAAEAAATPSTPEASKPAHEDENVEDLSAGLSSGQIQPFSLADLGLSPEEIAALGLGGNSGAAQSFTSMLGDDEPAEAASATPSTPEPVIEAAPEAESPQADDFDFLSDDSLGALELVDEEPADEKPVAETHAEDDLAAGFDSLSPFSLSDLGLSQDEIDALGLDDQPEDTGLRITEEELKGLDMGGDIDLSEFQLSESTPATPEPEPEPEPLSSFDLDLNFDPEPEPEPEPAATGTGDPLLDRLLDLGTMQGYVDIADIIAGVENPEAEAERIEQIGQILHENNIKIFDGDEEVDMEAEYEVEEEEQADDLSQIDFADVRPTAEEPDMTPFSLSDLGLSDDEIASLGLGEPAPKTREPEPVADESDMTPFSLADLGLSEDEIADLGLNDIPETTPEPAAEPEMTPFSLADLGLSDDEIADLGLGDAPAATPAPADDEDEPEMTPFALSDLGLTEEELASLEPDLPETPKASASPSLDIGSFSLDDILAEPTPEEPKTPTPAPSRPVDTPPVAATPHIVEPAAQPTPAQQPTPIVQPRQSPGLSNSLSEQVPALGSYLKRLEQDPQNHALRLSLARISGQIGQAEAAIQQYKNIIRQNVLLDIVVDDLSDLISDTDDPHTLQRLHRLLGDAYSKQGRIDDAISEYNWIYGNN
ncbi:tetratricopeptide repeat protein [Chloroflexia bacterium SDU3-3]|nr:tetratricopeptide repeat protein [Chloroflexia bacterium SDU3-3]